MPESSFANYSFLLKSRMLPKELISQLHSRADPTLYLIDTSLINIFLIYPSSDTIHALLLVVYNTYFERIFICFHLIYRHQIRLNKILMF